jgi:hypothetical protein
MMLVKSRYTSDATLWNLLGMYLSHFALETGDDDDVSTGGTLDVAHIVETTKRHDE